MNREGGGVLGIVWTIEIPRKTKHLYSVLYHITVRTQAKIELTICSMFFFFFCPRNTEKYNRHICWFTKLLVERVHHHRQLWKNKQNKTKKNIGIDIFGPHVHPIYTHKKKSLDTKFVFTVPLAEKNKTQLTLTGHTKPTSGHRGTTEW